MHLLRLKNVPIFEQLQLEEALLRLDERDICIVNEGSPPAIVMGISGQASALIDEEKLSDDPIPVIKRFSGGGTVVVDEETLFISFLCQSDSHPFAPYPEPIMRWTEEIYKEAFALPNFQLKENDYVIGEKKCGGNAQYLRKQRWLHHSTFLWDYKKSRMDLLLHPKRTPKYREKRSHEEFITRLSEHLPSKEEFIQRFLEVLDRRHPLTELSLDAALSLLDQPHRQSTVKVPVESLL
ncbi:MAG: Lipoate-protein ligase LplJ [Chlamydiae bacterium]|nr:Lipoate-protein ligase LplJ [Chlamydiota bacterium]